MSNLTAILISFGALMAVLGFDVYLALTSGNTITNWVRDHVLVTHWMAFMFGYLMSHWFGWF